MGGMTTISQGANKVLLNAVTTVVAGDAWHPLAKDKTFLIFHAAGAGDTVIVEGTNDQRVITDPTNALWVTLRDTGNMSAAATLISSASGAGAVAEGFSNNEAWKWVRARKSVAGAGVESTVVLGT